MAPSRLALKAFASFSPGLRFGKLGSQGPINKSTCHRLEGYERIARRDPAKLAKALIQLASQEEPPLRWAAGADAIGTFEQKVRDFLAQADAHRELSSSLGFDEAVSAGSGGA